MALAFLNGFEGLKSLKEAFEEFRYVQISQTFLSHFSHSEATRHQKHGHTVVSRGDQQLQPEVEEEESILIYCC